MSIRTHADLWSHCGLWDLMNAHTSLFQHDQNNQLLSLERRTSHFHHADLPSHSPLCEKIRVQLITSKIWRCQSAKSRGPIPRQREDCPYQKRNSLSLHGSLLVKDVSKAPILSHELKLSGPVPYRPRMPETGSKRNVYKIDLCKTQCRLQTLWSDHRAFLASKESVD